MDDVAPCHEVRRKHFVFLSCLRSHEQNPRSRLCLSFSTPRHTTETLFTTTSGGSGSPRPGTPFLSQQGLGLLPNITRCPINAEFFVTRERIQAHPRKFYCQAIQWILDSQEQAGLNSYQVGCIFENLWHYIFGEPAQMHGLTVPECELYDCCCWP